VKLYIERTEFSESRIGIDRRGLRLGVCGFFSQREWVGFTLEAERKNGPTRLREAQGLRFERIRETSMKPKTPPSFSILKRSGQSQYKITINMRKD